MTDCIFCKIIQNELPATKIFEDDEVLVFLNNQPVNEGHLLAVPKEHFENIYEIPDKLLGNLMIAVKNMAEVVKLALKADGINLIMNNDKAAGQVIFHAHVHIIPRFENDGYEHWHGKKKFTDVDYKKTAEKIQSLMGAPKKRPNLLD